jgi:sulfatase modifying factor 1
MRISVRRVRQAALSVVLLAMAGGVMLARTLRATETLPPGTSVPAGMVYVPGGRTDIGADDGNADERPVHGVRVHGFFMDRHAVTVAEFGQFVAATGYVTQAERFGSGGAFDPVSRRWGLVQGATWRRPFGAEVPAAAADHPVTQVSWNDAAAYAAWRHARLPSEEEWEHAARGATNRRSRYAWGDSLESGGRFHANTWNGVFPDDDSGADGFRATTSPVGAFGQNALGLSDMGGNVWEWTASWYGRYDADGAESSSAGSERTLRGGSYLCSPNYCHGFRVSARSHTTPESSLAHVGFRTVKDIP